MPRSVIIATASAGLALAFTAFLATPSMAMSFSDYDGTAGPLSTRIEAGTSFSGREGAAARKRDREARQLAAIRAARDPSTGRRLPFDAEPGGKGFSFTLPFTAIDR